MVLVQFEDWGLIPYGEALEKQRVLQSNLVKFKTQVREGILPNPRPPQYLIFCQHPPVYTLGNRATNKNLLVSNSELTRQGIELFSIRRGGDITFHGPGQIVGYLILDLEMFFTDIHKFLRYIEEAIIQTLSEWNLASGRISGLSGVWIEPEDPIKARKICAIGVHCSRWVTMHGFALNINTNLNYFKNIIPCGINDKEVTSLNEEFSQAIKISRVKETLLAQFSKVFGMQF